MSKKGKMNNQIVRRGSLHSQIELLEVQRKLDLAQVRGVSRHMQKHRVQVIEVYMHMLRQGMTVCADGSSEAAYMQMLLQGKMSHCGERA